VGEQGFSFRKRRQIKRLWNWYWAAMKVSIAPIGDFAAATRTFPQVSTAAVTVNQDLKSLLTCKRFVGFRCSPEGS
jgi:hypothetical protein